MAIARLETGWRELTIDTAPHASRMVVSFFGNAKGFDHQLWSVVTHGWEVADPYFGRVSKDVVWVLPPVGDDIVTTDCWLAIGHSKHVRVPCFKPFDGRKTYWQIAEGRLQFSVYRGRELQLLRHLIPRR